jgi:hypothetical protein
MWVDLKAVGLARCISFRVCLFSLALVKQQGGLNCKAPQMLHVSSACGQRFQVAW